MSIDYNYITAHVDLGALRYNYRLLRSMAGCLAPVIKADAYGHGLVPVAQALAQEGADTLCVGSAAEGAKLRGSGFPGRIVVLLGVVAKGDAGLCWKHGLTPLAGSSDHLARLASASKNAPDAGTPLNVALKFDTGMSRLGFSPEKAQHVAEMLVANPSLRLDMVCSHLAAADSDDPAYTQEQTGRFTSLCSQLASAGLNFRACLANSAAILAHPDTHLDMQRPGIALYGANPLHGTKKHKLGAGLCPVMRVSAPVVEVRQIPAGTSVSYGCTYTARQDTTVAVVAAGYADAYSRGLSGGGEGGGGQMCLATASGAHRANILGRVCMQLTLVDATGLEVAPGDTAWLLGGPPAAGGPGLDEASISPEELAQWWGTIPYEFFCLLGQNQRKYG